MMHERIICYLFECSAYHVFCAAGTDVEDFGEVTICPAETPCERCGFSLESVQEVREAL